MENPKILLLAAGRRYSFVKLLQEHGLDVYSYELDKRCPIHHICETYIGNSHSYPIQIHDINRIIEKNNIQLVLPMNDYWSAHASSVFTKYKDSFTEVVSSESRAAHVCYDKKEFDKVMMASPYSINYPTYRPFFDSIAKPQYGNSSIGLVHIPWYDVLTQYRYRLSKDFVVQRKIDQRVEVSVDAYFNKSSKFIGGVPRTRDRVAGGEVVDSTVIPFGNKEAKDLLYLTEKIGEHIGLKGPTCFQFMKDQSPGYIAEQSEWKLFEINARFGGGCTLTIRSGFDMIQMMINEYIYNKDINNYRDFPYTGLTMKRVFNDTFTVT